VGDSHAEDIDKRVRGYLLVGSALLLLTGITVGVAWLHLPVKLAVGVALAVATLKASLVACFFMHLISERKLIYGVLLLTVAFFFVLLLLPTFTASSKVGS
jgi:cytochrome c oxidase subunit 4